MSALAVFALVLAATAYIAAPWARTKRNPAVTDSASERQPEPSEAATIETVLRWSVAAGEAERRDGTDRDDEPERA